MNPEQVFNSFFRDQVLSTGYTFLIAVSGGVDSVVLSELMNQSKINFAIAHCNFGLRGDESDRDENFVKELAAKYGVEFFVKKFSTNVYAKEKNLSIQVAARNLRYEYFSILCEAHHFLFTVLAHHADDNIETVLMNFFRGTGLNGLTGMSELDRERKLLRPLLHIRRKEILQYAKEKELSWVEDSSNSSSKYTRNFFRNELIPEIKKVYPNADENILRNVERFSKTNKLYQLSVQQLKNKIVVQTATELHIPVKQLMQFKDSSLVYEIIREYGFGEKQVEEVIKLADGGSGRFIENESFQIIRHRNWFIIAPKTIHSDTIAIRENQNLVSFSEGSIAIKTFSAEKYIIRKEKDLAQLDAKNIGYPLILRRWKKADYFYPFGLHKKKKLSRFFIDQKLSKNQKENVWVLESNKKIIWVVGMRIDDRCRITNATTKILQFSYSK